MDTEKAKALVNATVEKAKTVAKEIQSNFKADEGTTGARKFASMFANLWKSGQTGKAALVACSVVVVLLGIAILPSSNSDKGDGTTPRAANTTDAADAARNMSSHSDKGDGTTPRAANTTDAALRACQKMAASDFYVIDCRKGIEWEADEFAKAQQEYEENLKWICWEAYCAERRKARDRGTSEERLDKAGFPSYSFEDFCANYDKIPSKYRIESVTDAQIKKHKVAFGGRHEPPGKLKVKPENLIKIAIKKEGKPKDEWPGLCFVRMDEKDKVKDVFFSQDGMSRLFNAGDLSAEEFARALVKQYGIPGMKADVQSERFSAQGDVGEVRTSTWTHKDPKGYEIEVFDRVFLLNGRKTELPGLFGSQLAVLGKQPRRYFDFSAITPETERKFD